MGNLFDKTIDLLDVGMMDYDRALEIQLMLHEQCWQRKRPDVLLLQENPPTITLGRDAKREHLLWNGQQLEAEGICLREIRRGGDITYHGPGQLVASPILHFREYAETALGYLRMLEQTVIDLLEGYGVEAGRVEGKSGVWVGTDKIAAVGLHVSRSVTMHGVALNICPDMSHFEAIIPCGISDMGVISMQRLGINAELDEVKLRWIDCFSARFNVCLSRIFI